MEASHLSSPATPATPVSKSPPFLSLPAVLRKQIYLRAGLVSDAEIDLNGGREIHYHWGPQRPFQVSHDLLLTCRTFYTDIHPILYSTNVFYIRYRDKENLERLRILSPDTIALLTQLTVYLNDSCHYVHPEHISNHNSVESDKPLEASCQATLFEWQRAASHIVAHVKLSTLRFFLVCDSANVETAEAVVEPLRIAPTLADCRIRLAQKPNLPLQKLAQEVSMRAIGYQYPPAESPFRYLDLPRELRLKILQYTDLVTPLREVEWSSENKFSLRYSYQSCGQNGCEWLQPCYPASFPACQFRNCWHLGHKNAGCFCQRHHAAFSSICHCWAPPTSLFLVCKEVQQDAQATFYSKNRFVIVPPSDECYRPVKSTPKRLDISIFLRDIVPPEALGFLKFLDIVFPPFYDDYLGDDEPAYQNWLQTIDHIGDLVNLPVLTLRVHMADICLYPEHAPEYRTKMTEEESQTIVNAYERAIKPLSKLREKGLNRFFTDLTLPWGRTVKSIRKRNEDPSAFMAESRELQLWGERLVMGGAYDSRKQRTGDPDEPQWRISTFEHYYV
jgi:hypothetical protein